MFKALIKYQIQALDLYIQSLVRVEITDLTKPQSKSSVYGTCAHFSSMDQNEKSHNLQNSSFAVQ